MAKKKYFLTKKLMLRILKIYNRKYILREELSEWSSVTYTEKNNRYLMLTFTEKWEENMSYILVTLTDETGQIIRKDRYDFVDERKKEVIYNGEK